MQLLLGVYNLELKRRLVINGSEFVLAVNQSGHGAPDAKTVGLPGVIYMDEDTGNLYKCISAADDAYTWEPAEKGAGYYTLEVTQTDAETMHIDFIPSNENVPVIPGQDIKLPSGLPGKDGSDGVDGADGITPHIGDNGNWFIGEEDTGKPSRGIPGESGKDGVDGQDGYTPQKNVDYFDGKDGQDGSPGKDGVSVTHEWNGTILSVTSASGTSSVDLKGEQGEPGKDGYTPQKNVDYFDGNPGKDGSDGSNGKDGNGIKSAVLNADYTLTLTFDNGTSYTTPSIRGATGAAGSDGQPGQNGSDGVGIASIAQTTTSTADGGDNVFTVTLTNGNKATFTVKNGSKGSAGADGKNGTDGKTPVKGTDYYTSADKAEMVNLVLAALPTWTGGSY